MASDKRRLSTEEQAFLEAFRHACERDLMDRLTRHAVEGFPDFGKLLAEARERNS